MNSNVELFFPVYNGTLQLHIKKKENEKKIIQNDLQQQMFVTNKSIFKKNEVDTDHYVENLITNLPYISSHSIFQYTTFQFENIPNPLYVQIADRYEEEIKLNKTVNLITLSKDNERKMIPTANLHSEPITHFFNNNTNTTTISQTYESSSGKDDFTTKHNILLNTEIRDYNIDLIYSIMPQEFVTFMNELKLRKKPNITTTSEEHKYWATLWSPIQAPDDVLKTFIGDIPKNLPLSDVNIKMGLIKIIGSELYKNGVPLETLDIDDAELIYKFINETLVDIV